MSDTVLQALIYATLAGITMPLGAMLAAIPHIGPRWLESELRHAIIAFGGGALLAAVALVLVPEGTSRASIPVTVIAFAAGGLAAMSLDRLIRTHSRGGTAGQFMAMLLDFIPEAMAMGAMLASGAGRSTGLLLALLIALQNLPEGFNAFREITHGKRGRRCRTIGLFCALVLLGPLAAFTGESVLDDMPVMLGVVMLFAAGGIVYLTFQDIAPEARMRRHWGPPFGAVAGFLLGMTGHMLLAP